MNRKEKLSVREVAIRELELQLKGKITRFDPSELFEKLSQGVDEAEEYLNKALAFDMHYTAAWKLYAKTLVKLGKSQEAKAAFEKGIVIAEQKGDKQAAKEMQVFLKRLQKQA